jgi:hypothetical protein
LACPAGAIDETPTRSDAWSDRRETKPRHQLAGESAAAPFVSRPTRSDGEASTKLAHHNDREKHLVGMLQEFDHRVVTAREIHVAGGVERDSPRHSSASTTR